MYLSKVRVDWSFSRNSYSLHKALWRLFPDHPPETRRDREQNRLGFLYRVEQRQTGHAAMVLLQSSAEPVANAAGVCVGASKRFEPALTQGQMLRFRLTANPVRTISDARGRLDREGNAKKVRVPLLREDQQTDWLSRQLEAVANLHRESLTCHQEAPLYFRKGDAPAAKIQPVTFEGDLTVRSPEGFVTLLLNGIGPAKGLGCGLMSVAAT